MPTERPAAPTEAPAAPTEAPTVEESAAPAPGPATTPAAATSDEGSSPWWPWLLAALAVAAAVVGVIALVRRSPKAAPSPAPPAPTAAVLAQSDEISTHLVGLAPGGLGSVAGADASRLAVLITMVEQLMTSAPDETSRRALATLHEPMRSLHSALDAIALTPHPPSDAEVAEIRARATTLHSATSLARASPPPAVAWAARVTSRSGARVPPPSSPRTPDRRSRAAVLLVCRARCPHRAPNATPGEMDDVDRQRHRSIARCPCVDVRLA